MTHVDRLLINPGHQPPPSPSKFHICTSGLVANYENPVRLLLMKTMDAFVDALPKVELHVHLVGSASVPTVLELAARHPSSPVPRTEPELRAF
jgi:hypothetical protein